jgi:hypothetical protein
MRTLFVILLTILFSLKGFGTPQIEDKIIYNGKEYKLQTAPLFGIYYMETYFKKYPDKRPKSELMSTGLHRGYVATFEVKENLLYLNDIEIEVYANGKNFPTKWKSVKNEIFPNQKLIKIDWVTGLLVLPFGKTVDCGKYYGDNWTYENYVLLEMNKGILKRVKQFSYTNFEKFKEKQFEAFKQTDEYEKIKIDLQKKHLSDKQINSKLRNNVIEYSSKILVE